MGLKNFKQRMAEVNSQITKLREELNEKGKQAFSEACKELFSMHPNLKAFRWTQYAPYFNDGDECTFSAHDVCIQLHTPLTDEEVGSIDGVYDDECNDDGQWLSGWRCPSNDPTSAALRDCRAVRDLLDEDCLKGMFGDHVEVTVTAQGVETKEYEHE